MNYCLIILFSSFCISIIGIFIWFCLDTQSQNQKQIISSYGLEYLIKSYLVKSFQKVIWCLSQMHTHLVPSSEIQVYQSQFVNQFTSSFTKKMFGFVRGSEISKSLLDNLYLGSFEKINIFLLPDIFVTSNNYYYHLLDKSSSCFMNKPIDMGDQNNETSKQYLANLIRDYSTNLSKPMKSMDRDTMEWTTISLSDDIL